MAQLADTRSWVRTRADALHFLAEKNPVLSGRLVIVIPRAVRMFHSK